MRLARGRYHRRAQDQQRYRTGPDLPMPPLYGSTRVVLRSYCCVESYRVPTGIVPRPARVRPVRNFLLPPYAAPTRCPVLKRGIVLVLLLGTDAAYGSTCSLYCPSTLSGTDIAPAATRSGTARSGYRDGVRAYGHGSDGTLTPFFLNSRMGSALKTETSFQLACGRMALVDLKPYIRRQRGQPAGALGCRDVLGRVAGRLAVHMVVG
eukprot:2276138-Rhodomonas_salina.3